MSMTLEVYSGETPNKKIAVVPFRLSPQFLEEIGEGSGTFSVHSTDERLPYLQIRNYVKVRVLNDVVAAFVITGLEPKYVDSGEFAGLNTVVKGKGLLSQASDAVVRPHGGLKASSPDTRSFNFASPSGSWLQRSAWVNPKVVAKVRAKGNKWGTAPAEWPDFPTAAWIWAPGTPLAGLPPIFSGPTGGFCYFRREFTVSSKGKYSFFVAADGVYEVYVDGQKVSEAKPGKENWTKTQRVDFELLAGNHVVAVKVFSENWNSGLIGAIAEVGDSGNKKKARLVSVTNASTWKVLPYPDSNPGWTPGEIMNQLISEAKTRGIRWARNVKTGYTNKADSYGNLWNRDVDYTFSVGEDYLSVINKLVEGSCDVWMDPSDNTLHMALERGVDRTKPSSVVDVVQLMLGKNLIAASEYEESNIKNTLVVDTSTGKFSVKDTKSILKYGVIEASLNLSTDARVSKVIAERILTARSDKTVSANYKIVPTEGAVPFKDFQVGDWVLAPGGDGPKTRRRVSSIAISEDKGTGAVLYDLEFDTILKSRQQHLDRWVSSNQSGSMGGTVLSSRYSNRTDMSTVGSVWAGEVLGDFELVGAGASAIGYFDQTGTPKAEVTVSWGMLDENGNELPDNPYKYEVYGIPNPDNPNNLVLHAITTDTETTVTGLPAGEDYTLRVVTKSDSGAEVAAENLTVGLPMPGPGGLTAPSRPEVVTSQGTVTVVWDGTMHLGGVKPPQISHVRAVASSVPGGPYLEKGPIIPKEGGTATFVGLPRGEDRYVSLVTVDVLGNESEASYDTLVNIRGIDGEQDIEVGTIKKELLDYGILSELGDLESATKDRAMLVKNHSFEATGVWGPVQFSAEVPETDLGRVDVGEAEAYDGVWVVRATTAEYVDDPATLPSTLSISSGASPIDLRLGGTYAASIMVRADGGGLPASGSVSLTVVEEDPGSPSGYVEVSTVNVSAATLTGDWKKLETPSFRLDTQVTGQYKVRYALLLLGSTDSEGVSTVYADSVEVYDRTPIMAVNGNTYSPNPPAGDGEGPGSTWYQYDVDEGIPGDIIGMWRWSGAEWEPMALNNQVIANLDAGKIDTGFLNAARILAASITTDKLSATAIDGMTITGAIIRTAEIGQRLQLDVDGLKAYNSSGSVTADLRAGEGTLELTGSLLVGDGDVTSTYSTGRIASLRDGRVYMATDFPGQEAYLTSTGFYANANSVGSFRVDHVTGGSGTAAFTGLEIGTNGSKGVKIDSGAGLDLSVNGIASRRLQVDLWVGEVALTEAQTVNFSGYTLSSQLNGIVLEWSSADAGVAVNNNWNFTYIPKAKLDTAGGGGINAKLIRAGQDRRKYFYVYNDRIVGHADNRSPNNDMLLRRVIGY